MTKKQFLLVRIFAGVSIALISLALVSGCTPKTESKDTAQTTKVAETNAAAPAPSPVPEKSTTLEARGVAKPDKREIHWTAYYITPAKMADPGKGKDVKYTNLAGETKTLHLTTECYNQAEIEAAAVGVDKNGVEHFAYRVSPGVWKELPQGCAGMGNKLNALVPLDHVAAQQSKFPFGSMVYLPMAVGLKLGDAELSDGYFWVSDVGSAIIGNHFDLFVGKESIYKDFVSRDLKPTYPTTIYKLPAAPKGLDPRTDDGLAAILRGKDFLREDVAPEEKYKILDALLLFQQANPHIPIAEYGNPRAATTLWFLTQAALEITAAKTK